jgi:hypothetical protein
MAIRWENFFEMWMRPSPCALVWVTWWRRFGGGHGGECRRSAWQPRDC